MIDAGAGAKRARLRQMKSIASGLLVTADGAHQRVLARILPVLAGWLDGQRAEIKRRFAKRSLLTPGFVDAYIVNRFVDGMVYLVDEIARTPDHPMRREFDAYVRELVVRLCDDPEMRAQAGRLRTAIARGSELDELVTAGWSALRERLERPPSGSPDFGRLTARRDRRAHRRRDAGAARARRAPQRAAVTRLGLEALTARRISRGQQS